MGLSQARKYAAELEKERTILDSKNPFKEKKKVEAKEDKKRHPHHVEKKKPTNYFSLILSSDFEDLELEIRGLRYVKVIDDKGREKVILEKKTDHYLSDDGAEDILTELKAYLNPDNKLGRMTHEEFLRSQEIIRKAFTKYFRKSLYRLGMDTEDKQRKMRPLATMILLRIRQVFSRSIEGKENQLSHGEIKLAGDLDSQKQDRFSLEDAKNSAQ